MYKHHRNTTLSRFYDHRSPIVTKKRDPRMQCLIDGIIFSNTKVENTNSPHPNPREDRQEHIGNRYLHRRKKALSGISTNMLWADMKAAFGQRLNLEGIICTAKMMVRDQNLALPQAKVEDIRWIDWAELHRRGFKGVVFDKDNTVTAPYVSSLWPPLEPCIRRCKSVFGHDNVAIFSNSAGLFQFDPDGSKATALEHQIGMRVIRHRVKKPAGDAQEIEKHFGCPSEMLVMVGDRRFTDVVYGNRNGFFTILTEPFSDSGEPFVVKQVRKVEDILAHRWCKRGLNPIQHSLLPDPQVICVREPPTPPSV